MRTRWDGFTIIELLVVIAVLALLLSILLPSVSSARRRARTAACLVNLRQLAVATASYAGDAQDALPYPVGSRTIGGKTVSYESALWFTALDRYLSRTRLGDLSRTTAAGERSYMKWKECAVWEGFPQGPANPPVNNTLTIKEYSRTIKMNTHLRRIGGDFARYMDIDRPNLHVLYGDGTSIDQIEWPADTTETSQFSMDVNEDRMIGAVGGIALRHGGAANVVFVDGHASTETHPVFQRPVRATGLRVPSWQSEFMNGSGVQVRTAPDPKKSLEAQGLQRNKAMPLVWSIPGRLYRP